VGGEARPFLRLYSITCYDPTAITINEPSQADAGCPTDAGGAVDAMHDSFMPLGGMVLILNMVLGEITFGGVMLSLPPPRHISTLPISRSFTDTRTNG
jgi:hypothetical protein